MRYITKSDIKRGMQCLKQAHLHRFYPELATPVDEYQQLIMSRGDFVGEFAQDEFNPKTSKMLYQKNDSNDEVLRKTKIALADPKLTTLFEPAFLYNGVYVRCDILHRTKGSDEWKLIEVKSGSKMDDDYVLDANIQQYVLKKAGLKVKEVYVWHINKECVLPDISKLFKKVAVSAELPNLVSVIESTIEKLKVVFEEKDKKPVVKIGEQCDKPFECPFKGICHQKENKIPDFSVFDIPRIGRRAWDFYAKGLIEVNQLDPADFTENQARVITVTKTNVPYLNKPGISESLKDWKFPLYLLDFEAMEYDLPGLPGTTPGIHTPFQFSLHVIKKPGGKIEKLGEYLHKDGTDPRQTLVNKMSELIGETGSIVSFAAGYEKSKLERMSPSLTKKSQAIIKKWLKRFVDPLPVLRDNVYFPEFKGSYSIKYVAPALIGPTASYEGMKVSNGTEAVIAYRKVIDPNTDPVEREVLRQALVVYCDKDTFVMGQIVNWLYGNV